LIPFFFTQQRPIFQAGASGAVFRDTRKSRRIVYCRQYSIQDCRHYRRRVTTKPDPVVLFQHFPG